MDALISEIEVQPTEALSDLAAHHQTRSNDGLRVLHVGKFYPPHKGGMETHLKALCDALSRKVKVEIIVANDRRETVEENAGGISVKRLGNLFNLSSSPICSGMVRAIGESEADIIHIHFPNPAAILAYLASGHAGRLVITWHSDIVRQKILGRAFYPFLKSALDRSSAIIATSPNYIESSPVLSAYKNRCHVIPLGVSPEKFEATDSRLVARIREQYGPRIVFSVGRLIYYKGFDVLIRAMKQVRDAHLLIAGIGPLRAALEKCAEDKGVRERTTFLGEVDDVVPYYHAADVFALASVARSEAFGLVQLEAMACGTAVVNTSLASGVPFVSADQVTGLTVPPSDAEALAGAINLLLADDSLRRDFGRNAQARVRQLFTLEMMAHRTLELYQTVMDGNDSIK